jgi:predicted nucleic acid-binding protein
MIFGQWSTGITIQSPVYLDANVLIGSTVNNHRLYKPCALLLGELIAHNHPIVLSNVAVGESFWAIARLAYADLMHQKPSANWGKQIYRRHVGQIFQQRRSWLTALPAKIRALVNAGYPIDVVRPSQSEWIQAMSRSVDYMDLLHLTPNDAIHLALADSHAQTFVTGDGDFSTVVNQQLGVSNLTVLLVQP